MYRHYRVMIDRHVKIAGDANIVELGCGPGYMLSFLQGWYPLSRTTGLDYDERLLQEARFRTSGAALVRGHAENLPFGSDTLDVVIALHTIEHLYNPGAFIAEITRVLRPEGVFLFTTPNPQGFGAKLMGKSWCGWHEDHVSVKTPSEWRTILGQYGFGTMLERTTGLTGIPLFRKFPLALLNWGALALFGSFPWPYGEAYVSMWRRPRS